MVIATVVMTTGIAGCGGGAPAKKQVATSLKTYLRAIADDNGAVACSHMARSFAQVMTHSASSLGATTCRQAVRDVASHLGADEKQKLLTAKVIDVRVSGASATARLKGGTQTAQLRHVGGHWLISQGINANYAAQAVTALERQVPPYEKARTGIDTSLEYPTCTESGHSESYSCTATVAEAGSATPEAFTVECDVAGRCTWRSPAPGSTTTSTAPNSATTAPLESTTGTSPPGPRPVPRRGVHANARGAEVRRALCVGRWTFASEPPRGPIASA